MASFDTRDSNRPEFWNERFEQGFLPWDKGGVPQALQDFVKRSPHARQTLIPGCGSGYEAAFLLECGWRVDAIDFSPAAVKTAREAVGTWKPYIHEADFFTFEPPQSLELIYERAFLCALPLAMRAAVAQRWGELLPAGGLLAGFFFFGETPKGPPFGISVDQLNDLLQPNFVQIEDRAVADSIPVFLGKERWQVWQRR